MPGTSTSQAEVTNVDSQGLWILIEGSEHFLAYEQYPWFREAQLRQVLNVETLSGGHLHWPDLDIDLSIEILRAPSRFPLKQR